MAFSEAAVSPPLRPQRHQLLAPHPSKPARRFRLRVHPVRIADRAAEIHGQPVPERARDLAAVAGVAVGPAGEVLDGGDLARSL
jgi:hypothetical protein